MITPARHLPTRWEDLTAKDFPEAVRRADGVCLLPIGCMEKHGDHLPLGTDVFEARAIADRVAAQEPAVIFPSYYVAQIAEARHAPGCVSYSQKLQWAMLEETVDEIERNGMDKIVIINGHGGNIFFLSYFAQCRNAQRHTAQVYVIWPWDEPQVDGHAAKVETGMMLHLTPGLVRLDDLSEPGDALDRARVLRTPGLFNEMGWYAQFPRHYSGNAAGATAEFGERCLETYSRRVAEMVRQIKAGDPEVRALADEFHTAAEDPLRRAAVTSPVAP